MKGQKYPVNPNLAQYHDVKVCRECSCMPGGFKRKNAYQFTKPILQALARSYNPVGLYCAPVNRDHDGIWYGGPAEGVVTALRYEEEDGKGILLADLANFPDWIADQIDGLQWTSRSIEWIDAPDLAAWYQEMEIPMPIERLRFYGTEDYYLTGLALLGQYEPAVPGLGPMPSRFAAEADADGDREPLEVIILPAAAAQYEQQRYAAFQINRLEADMTGAAPAQEKPRTNFPSAHTAAQPPGAPASPPDGGDTVESLRAQLQLTQGLVAELQAAAAPAMSAEEAEQLRANNAQLMARDRDREIESEIRELQARGDLTPASSDTYRQLARQLHGMAGEDTAQPAPLELVKELLAKAARPHGGEVAPDENGHSNPNAARTGAKTNLDAGDREVLAGLRSRGRDFSDAEYLEYLNSGKLPERFTGKSQGESG